MELEKVTAEIRPRSDWEAIDLGVSLTRAHFPMIFKGWMASVFPVCLVIFLLCWNAPGWGIFLVWWLKPIWERVALHPLSRKLFGESPTWRGTLKVLPQEMIKNKLLVIMGLALTGVGWLIHHDLDGDGGRVGLATLFWLTVLGLSFYRSGFSRSLMLPIRYLEGLSGAQYRTRSQVLGLRGIGAAAGLTLIAVVMEGFVFYSQFYFIDLMLPTGTEWSTESLAEDFFMGGAETLPAWSGLLVAIFYLNAVSVVTWFYVGGGFGLYLNSRTLTEGWDIELHFKRLGQRLGIVIFAMALLTTPTPVSAAEPQERAEAILDDDAFTVQTREVEKSRGSKEYDLSGGAGVFAGVGQLIFWIIVVVAIGGVIWLIVANAHVFRRGRSESAKEEEKTVKTVAGMNIAPESLPADVLSAAQRLWADGSFKEALGLLYRGAISSLVTRKIVEIEESDTEMDCLRRVAEKGDAASAPYFATLTGAWMQQAYAQRTPEDEVVEELWSRWPFKERGRG